VNTSRGCPALPRRQSTQARSQARGFHPHSGLCGLGRALSAVRGDAAREAAREHARPPFNQA